MKKLLTISLLLFHVRGDNNFTLTTATVRDSTSAKPTTLYRRINVERSVEDRWSTPLDLFRLRDLAVRRSRSEIWNWDSWCQMQPKKEKCASKDQLRYYYNAQLDQCSTFIYTGCKGNKNNFETLLECERHCKGSIHMSLNDADPDTFCSLQPHAGLCMAMFKRYYYDVNDNTCKTFVYGGCGGNGNRFDTEEKCLRHCRSSKYFYYYTISK